MVRQIKESRFGWTLSSLTLWFNSLLLFLVSIAQSASTPPLSTVIAALPEKYRTAIVTAVQVVLAVNIALRFRTQKKVKA